MLMSYGELFAGVDGMGLGLQAEGWYPRFLVEWDPVCQAVLRRHHNDIPILGDVKDVNGGELPYVDVLAFGFPCQDLSNAGRQAGLDGSRSGLFFEAIRIIKEMQHAGRAPTWLLIENVVGLLQTGGGAAMGRCLAALQDVGALVVEWAVLDAQHFGVPQRRRRVFIVACLDPAIARICPDPLLPVSEGRRRDPRSSGQAESVVAALTANGVGTCGADDNQAQAGHIVPALTTKCGSTFDDQQSQQLVVAVHLKQDPINGDPSPALGTTSAGMGVHTGQGVRRLTPMECERLMGWPDGHTAYGVSVSGLFHPISDSRRYKMCGNGVASPCAAWVARQINKVHNQGGAT